MYSYIFWDFDGVLADSENLYYDVWKKILPSNIKFDKDILVGKSNHQFLRSLGFKLSSNEIDDLIKLKDHLILKKISLLNINEDLIELIDTLSLKHNCKFKITSNNSMKIIKKYLLNNNLSKYFEEIIVHNTFLKPKPSPDIYEFASKGILKSNILIIEDSIDGIQSAKLSGMKTVKFNYDNINQSIRKIKEEFTISNT